MRSRSAMKLHLLFVVSFAWAFHEMPPPKYQHRDPVTSELHLCDQCPPGTAVKRHCSAGVPTVCAPCPENHFSEQWHWGETCQYCTSVCKERQLVVRECNSTHDRLCECAQGYHLEVEFCVKHATCAPGWGVSAPGTPDSDTVCERCSQGYFSSVASATEPCLPHRNCSRMGLRVAHPGTATQDETCECDQGPPQCRTDTTLCQEAIFHFLASQRLCSEPLDPQLSAKKMEKKVTEHAKVSCRPGQQTLKLLRLWREQAKDKDERVLLRGVSLCEKKVSRCVGLRNLSLSDLTAVMDSLPGSRVRQEEVRQMAGSCPSQQSILRLLLLWKSQNKERDLAQALTQSLPKLKAKDVTPLVLRDVRKISRIFSASSLHKMCKKLLFDKSQDSKCFRAKSYND
ncbi:tumor necrosis factor receptor superfamily member 11B-like isoform X1 [Brienomyrus brachyistius]|uniref:tumor necrosis factor receptor superfamily member 11B-like isoform X1 n=2 Tax=Brienomyrus brachyistius TaxID=42636 RepID=UPI0020B3DAEF|nr:tumor necrosis factor receptor superfamily member 11B-like isoform X1 [Brienomyrus brachyistius]